MQSPTIIVFSKDRPMQLHAYLESLLFFSDAVAQNITVLYKETEGISYDKVISEFPLVTWVNEKNFYDDFNTAMNNAGQYIMFGCDDVVFTRSFNLKQAQEVLSANEQIFGFSFRVGNNIPPVPTNISKDKQYIEWNWKTMKSSHYNYPWELNCTLYRKQDVMDMLATRTLPIKSPNYLEGDFAADPHKYIQRPHLAGLNKHSQALVITVNRVQDTHCNPIDETALTDIHSLNKIYNQDNNRLDIATISEIDNYSVHVGSEYFVLKHRESDWKKPVITPPRAMKKGILRSAIKCIKALA
jgi:hypothetical protein